MLKYDYIFIFTCDTMDVSPDSYESHPSRMGTEKRQNEGVQDGSRLEARNTSTHSFVAEKQQLRIFRLEKM